MFMKNIAGKDSVWEAQQRGNEEMVGWILAFGEEQIVGETTEEDVAETEGLQTENGDTKKVESGKANEESSTRDI